MVYTSLQVDMRFTGIGLQEFTMLTKEKMREYQRKRRALLKVPAEDLVGDKKVPCLKCAEMFAVVLQRDNRIKELESILNQRVPEKGDDFKLVMLQKRYALLEKENRDLKVFRDEHKKESPFRGF